MFFMRFCITLRDKRTLRFALFRTHRAADICSEISQFRSPGPSVWDRKLTKIDEIADFKHKTCFFLKFPNPRRERSDSRGLFVIVRSLFRRFRRAFLRFISKISHFAADPEYVRAKCLSVMESNKSQRGSTISHLLARRCDDTSSCMTSDMCSRTIYNSPRP